MWKYLSALGILAILLSCSKEEESEKVTKGDIVEAVYSSVSIQPENLYKVYAQVPGKIVQFKKKEGDSILFGETICLVEAVNVQSAASIAQLNLQLAKSQLSGNASLIESLNLDISSAKEQMDLDQDNLSRIQKLYDKGLSTDVERDQASLKATASANRYKSLILQKKRTEQDLQIKQKQAESTYLANLSSSQDATVRSFLNGKVFSIYKEEGEMAMVQEPVALIGSDSDYEIHLLVDEVDISKVNLGQIVVVQLEAYKNQSFEAEITRINPSMERQTQSFEVIAKFKEHPPRLYLGLTGEANIIVKEKKNALLIPREYLIDDRYVITEAGKTKVKTGLMSISHVEILEGVKEGENIYLPEE